MQRQSPFLGDMAGFQEFIHIPGFLIADSGDRPRGSPPRPRASVWPWATARGSASGSSEAMKVRVGMLQISPG
jgi:hypothetical protein